MRRFFGLLGCLKYRLDVAGDGVERAVHLAAKSLGLVAFFLGECLLPLDLLGLPHAFCLDLFLQNLYFALRRVFGLPRRLKQVIEIAGYDIEHAIHLFAERPGLLAVLVDPLLPDGFHPMLQFRDIDLQTIEMRLHPEDIS